MGKYKHKERTLQEIRKEIGLQTQDRRQFLNALLNISNFEMSVELKKKHIENMRFQLSSGNLTEKDKFGNLMDAEMLKRDITIFEFQLKQLELNLDFAKEDLHFILHTNEGVLVKAGGTIEDLKEKVNAHFLMIRDEYDKIKKVMERTNAV